MAPVSSLILLLSTIFNLPGKIPAPGGIRVFASVGQHGDVCNVSNSDADQTVCGGGLARQGPRHGTITSSSPIFFVDAPESGRQIRAGIGAARCDDRNQSQQQYVKRVIDHDSLPY